MSYSIHTHFFLNKVFGHIQFDIYVFIGIIHLHEYADPIKRVQLSWERRYKIIVGIARGLLYLHEDSQLRIIHRDLKISDFGMAKLIKLDQIEGNTKRVVGTL